MRQTVRAHHSPGGLGTPALLLRARLPGPGTEAHNQEEGTESLGTSLLLKFKFLMFLQDIHSAPSASQFADWERRDPSARAELPIPLGRSAQMRCPFTSTSSQSLNSRPPFTNRWGTVWESQFLNPAIPFSHWPSLL